MLNDYQKKKIQNAITHLGAAKRNLGLAFPFENPDAQRLVLTIDAHLRGDISELARLKGPEVRDDEEVSRAAG